jgi:hypothetical protein
MKRYQAAAPERRDVTAFPCLRSPRLRSRELWTGTGGVLVRGANQILQIVRVGDRSGSERRGIWVSSQRPTDRQKYAPVLRAAARWVLRLARMSVWPTRRTVRHEITSVFCTDAPAAAPQDVNQASQVASHPQIQNADRTGGGGRPASPECCNDDGSAPRGVLKKLVRHGRPSGRLGFYPPDGKRYHRLERPARADAPATAGKSPTTFRRERPAIRCHR